jgi:hypothetical protein
MKKLLLGISDFFEKYDFLLFLEDSHYLFLFVVFIIMFGTIGYAVIQCINFLFN